MCRYLAKTAYKMTFCLNINTKTFTKTEDKLGKRDEQYVQLLSSIMEGTHLAITGIKALNNAMLTIK